MHWIADPRIGTPRLFLRTSSPCISTMNDDLHSEIKNLMVDSLRLTIPASEIANDTPLFGADGLGLDSIDALDLVVTMEKRFGVTVPNSEAARQALATVDSLALYVQANQK